MPRASTGLSAVSPAASLLALTIPRSVFDLGDPLCRCHSTRRREMLQATAIGVAALATGCAAIGTGAKPRVVVVGGGWGGLGAVRGLLAGGGAGVTLVEPNEGFMWCPLSAHFIARFQPPT